MTSVATEPRILAAITEAKDRWLADDQALINLVVQARMLGFGWKRIAAALGTSHQAAMDRFKKHCPA